MRPMISNTPYYKLNIPEMSGGINLRDGISSINDNQLSEGKNVWFRDGLLRTRPAIRDINAVYADRFGSGPPCQIIESNVFKEGSKIFAVRVGAEENKTMSAVVTLAAVNEEGVQHALDPLPIECNSCFVTEKDGHIYTYFDGDSEGIVFKDLTRLTIEDMYVPTIATNCVVTGRVKYNATTNKYYYGSAISVSGINKEGYNLLTPYYKFIYSTVNKDLVKAEDYETITEVPMSYKLPPCPYKQNTIGCAGRKIKAVITDKDGNTFTHEATVSATGYASEEKSGKDGLRMEVGVWGVNFFKGEVLASTPLTDYVENNLEIILPSPNEFSDYEKVSKMTRSIWFGGEASGISGGTRLFLCGSTREGDENLVIWSDLNNPLYFPEHNCARIGNPTTKTTAFGKQGDKLVIFKENETFYTKYVESSSITAEALETQMIYDVTMATAYFPMVELNSNIGCDCPDTIQLCNNRLVWATSIGKVYELVSENQYSENSIYEVSQMIEPMLSKEDKLKMSSAADWDGKYLLAVGNKIYVMNYNSYGFSNIYSYSKREDANKQISWWYWDFDRGFGYDVVQHILSLNGKCVVLRLETIDESRMVCVASALEPEERKDLCFTWEGSDVWDGSDVETKDELRLEISSSAQTKYFSFGAPTVKKNIPKIELSLGATSGAPIRVDVITDRGTEENELIIDEETSNNKLPNYFVNRLIRVGDKNAHRIGLKFKCDGAFSLESMSLQYKQLGGLK